jgi:hypothetical protein
MIFNLIVMSLRQRPPISQSRLQNGILTGLSSKGYMLLSHQLQYSSQTKKKNDRLDESSIGYIKDVLRDLTATHWNMPPAFPTIRKHSTWNKWFNTMYSLTLNQHIIQETKTDAINIANIERRASDNADCKDTTTSTSMMIKRWLHRFHVNVHDPWQRYCCVIPEPDDNNPYEPNLAPSTSASASAGSLFHVHMATFLFGVVLLKCCHGQCSHIGVVLWLEQVLHNVHDNLWSSAGEDRPQISIATQ